MRATGGAAAARAIAGRAVQSRGSARRPRGGGRAVHTVHAQCNAARGGARMTSAGGAARRAPGRVAAPGFAVIAHDGDCFGVRVAIVPAQVQIENRRDDDLEIHARRGARRGRPMPPASAWIRGGRDRQQQGSDAAAPLKAHDYFTKLLTSKVSTIKIRPEGADLRLVSHLMIIGRRALGALSLMVTSGRRITKGKVE